MISAILVILMTLVGAGNTHYTDSQIIEYMTEEYGDYVATRDCTIAGCDCVNVWNGGSREKIMDSADYYIFDNEIDALMAYRYMSEFWLDDETDRGQNYIQGWMDCTDASVEKLIYITNNMIIVVDLQVESAWSEEGE